MKKSKIFMATGALLLAVSAIFATKASKKLGPAIFTAQIGNTGVLVQSTGAAVFTTAAKGGNLVTAWAYLLCTKGASGTVLYNTPLYTTVTGAKKVLMVK